MDLAPSRRVKGVNIELVYPKKTVSEVGNCKETKFQNRTSMESYLTTVHSINAPPGSCLFGKFINFGLATIGSQRVKKRPCFLSFTERLSKCENDNLIVKNASARSVRVSSPSLQRKQTGQLQGKTKSVLPSSSGLRNKTSRERTVVNKSPGLKRIKDSR